MSVPHSNEYFSYCCADCSCYGNCQITIKDAFNIETDVSTTGTVCHGEILSAYIFSERIMMLKTGYLVLKWKNTTLTHDKTAEDERRQTQSFMTLNPKTKQIMTQFSSAKLSFAKLLKDT